MPGADPGRHGPPRAAPGRVPGGAARRPGLGTVGGRVAGALWFLFRDDLLLARSPGFPAGTYSVLAGFVEPGESIEETVEREVREEVGIEVKGVRYFGSQPWSFPNSLMIGLTAEYAGGEIAIDSTEIEDAGWYEASEFPPLPPRVSIARAVIDDFAALRSGRA